MQWLAPAAWPAQLNAEEKILGQQQQGCLPTEDGFDTLASHANQSGVPWRWGIMDVAIPSTSRFVFLFPSLLFNKFSLFAVCIFRNNLHCSGPMHWLRKTRFKLRLNTMQCGAFPKALTFFLLLSSKMLTAYLAGLTTAGFCLPMCKILLLAEKKKELCKVIQPLPLVGMGLCCTLERHKSVLGNPNSHRFLAVQTHQKAVWHTAGPSSRPGTSF